MYACMYVIRHTNCVSVSVSLGVCVCVCVNMFACACELTNLTSGIAPPAGGGHNGVYARRVGQAGDQVRAAYHNLAASLNVRRTLHRQLSHHDPRQKRNGLHRPNPLWLLSLFLFLGCSLSLSITIARLLARARALSPSLPLLLSSPPPQSPPTSPFSLPPVFPCPLSLPPPSRVLSLSPHPHPPSSFTCALALLEACQRHGVTRLGFWARF